MIKRFPGIGLMLRKIYQFYISLPYVFKDSKSYWRERYQSGGNSGQGSYDELAEFKAEILNEFVSENKIETVIEFGCGDGNQLSYCNYPAYLGFDISPEAIARCRELFPGDDSKNFKLMREYKGESADLTLSLDVIFHLIEDAVFDEYMKRLFESSEKYVIIYSSNTNMNPLIEGAHVKHRKFTDWIDQYMPHWKLIKKIPNKYSLEADSNNGSPCDFFIYKRKSVF